MSFRSRLLLAFFVRSELAFSLKASCFAICTLSIVAFHWPQSVDLQVCEPNRTLMWMHTCSM